MNEIKLIKATPLIFSDTLIKIHFQILNHTLSGNTHNSRCNEIMHIFRWLDWTKLLELKFVPNFDKLFFHFFLPKNKLHPVHWPKMQKQIVSLCVEAWAVFSTVTNIWGLKWIRSSRLILIRANKRRQKLKRENTWLFVIFPLTYDLHFVYFHLYLCPSSVTCLSPAWIRTPSRSFSTPQASCSCRAEPTTTSCL